MASAAGSIMTDKSGAAHRSVERTLRASKRREGGGFIVRRPVGHEIDTIDPFLMLDHMGPVSYKPGEAVGAPDHPHRGYITFTYVIDGSFQHRDSSGAKGELGPGDAQYMVAGRGVVHAEMPSETIMREGGTVEGFQLWINLPSKKKMMEASYQDVPAAAMPVVPLLLTKAAKTGPEDGAIPSLPPAEAAAGSSEKFSSTQPRQQGSAKVVLGSTLSATGPIKLETAVTYVDLRLRPGSAIDVDIPKGQEGFVYAFRGNGVVGASHGGAKAADVEEGVMAQLGSEGGVVRVSCPGASHDGAPVSAQLLVPASGELKEDAGTDGTAAPRSAEVPLDEAGLAVLIVTGEPIGEPIVKYGPFVMNTQEEIVQAMRDYHSGRLGGAIEGAEERLRRTQEAKTKYQRSGTWKGSDREL